MILVFVVLHALRAFAFSDQQEVEFLLTFAFIPARYDPTMLPSGAFPGGIAGDAWTFITYAFIHGDLAHIAVNSVWLLAFGSAVARRFGTLRFLAFFALTAAAGAGAHLATHVGAFVPMIGASAAISGFMAAAMRFVFQIGGPLGLFRRGERDAYRVPAIPLAAAFRDPRILAFLIIWFALNLVFGFGSLAPAGDGQQIAWQAHMGGFIAGLVAFAWFDPVPAKTAPRPPKGA